MMYSPSSSQILSKSSSMQASIESHKKPLDSTLQNISAASFIFQLSLVLYCISRCIEMSELAYINIFTLISQILAYSTAGLLLIEIILFNRYKFSEIIIYLIIFVIAILGTYNYGNTQLIYLSLFIIGAKDLRAYSICRTALIVIAASTIAIILLSIMGIIGTRTQYTTNNLTNEIVYRQAFGFQHYNQLGHLSLIAFLCYLYLRYKKFNILDICITLIWAALLYFVVTTKTAPILMLIAVIFVLLSKIMSFKLFSIVCAIICCIAIIVSLLLAYYYDPSNPVMDQINTWLAGRLYYAHASFINFSITLFGQSINFNNMGIILDNAYVSLLFRYGIVALIAVIALYIYAFIKSYREQMLPIIILLTIMVLVGFVEIWFYTLAGIVVLAIAFSKHPCEVSKSNSSNNVVIIHKDITSNE